MKKILYKLHISKGNSKLGAIPNLSFPPGLTCRPGVPCLTSGCYALKLYKLYKTCKDAWDENYAYYYHNPKEFWEDLDRVFKTTRYFRYFVSGDIPDALFFKHMVEEATKNPHCEFLCFTKQFEIVNEAIGELPDYKLPDNLHLLFSGWEGLTMENPFGLPETAVITKDMKDIPDEWKICGGNCMECVCRGVGCWEVKSGETIAFHKH